MGMKKRNGFSLPELMVSMAVFSILMVLVAMILRGGEEQARTADMKMNVQEAARETLYKMALEVRQSSASKATISGGGNTLTFQIPSSVSNSGTITWSSPIMYQVGGNGDQLIRTDTGTGQTQVLANDIESITFTNGTTAGTLVMTVAARRSMTNGRVLRLTSTGEARYRN